MDIDGMLRQRRRWQDESRAYQVRYINLNRRVFHISPVTETGYRQQASTCRPRRTPYSQARPPSLSGGHEVLTHHERGVGFVLDYRRRWNTRGLHYISVQQDRKDVH